VKEPWWPPGSIIPTRKQVWWLLSNLDTIRAGLWPSEHRETGYAGSKSRHRKHSANYERPIQVSSELLQRIEKCWPDSAWLMLAVAYEDVEQVISNGENQDIRKIKRRINSALSYICGRKRKPYSYKEFKSHRKRRG
jgi:hypothetical protein